MTPQEAKEALKLINLKNIHPFYDWEEMLEVRDKAIEALEKQIPKKPIVVGEEYIFEKDEWEKDYECSTCGNPYIGDSFCSCCGQALDWSDRE